MSTENTNNPNQEEDVIANYANEMRQIEMQGYEKPIRKARNSLFVAGGLIFIFQLIAAFKNDGAFDYIALLLAIVIGGSLFALGFWTKTKPYSAILAGLAIFIAYQVLVVITNGIVNGSEGVLKALVSGIIVKVVILVNLIIPIKDAKELQEAKKENF